MQSKAPSKKGSKKQKDDHTDSTADQHRDNDSHHSDSSTSESFGRRVDNEFERHSIRCIRYFIGFLMLAVTASAVVLTYKYLQDQQDEAFDSEVS